MVMICESKRMSAFSISRLTLADSTPGCDCSARVMVAAHAPHVIPVMERRRRTREAAGTSTRVEAEGDCRVGESSLSSLLWVNVGRGDGERKGTEAEAAMVCLR